MRLLLVGSEYAGARTLARALIEWSRETMDAFAGVPDEYLIHDHFLMPKISHPPELTDEEHEQILRLSPRVKEMIQRHNILYHIPFTTSGADSMIIGLHIEDNVYGPLYFDYLADLDPDDPIMDTRNLFETWISLPRKRCLSWSRRRPMPYAIEWPSGHIRRGWFKEGILSSSCAGLRRSSNVPHCSTSWS